DYGDLVEEDVGLVPIQVEALFDDCLVVVVERDSAGIISAGAGEAAGLDREHVVLAVAIRVDPSTDGISEQGRLQSGGRVASVGEEATRIADVLDKDVRGVRRDDEFRLAIAVDYTRHAGRNTGVGFADALPAGRLVVEIVFEAGLVFGDQWRLL